MKYVEELELMSTKLMPTRPKLCHELTFDTRDGVWLVCEHEIGAEHTHAIREVPYFRPLIEWEVLIYKHGCFYLHNGG